MRLPKIKLDHLKTLTDDTGIIQHGKYSVPNKKTGYTTDDNTRALIAALRYNNLFDDADVAVMAGRYLEFMHYAQKENGKFHNELDYCRNYLDEEGSEDCQGRALWACGRATASSIHKSVKMLAKDMFEKYLPHIFSIDSLRARACFIQGLYYYHQEYGSEDIKVKIVELAESLLYGYKENYEEDWRWFERYLTYDNGKLSQVLFYVYELTKQRKYLDIAVESMNFLSELLFIEDKLVLIGQKQWCHKDGPRSYYDQQPIDADSMVELYSTAYRVTGRKEYKQKALTSFEWFLGRNSEGKSLYDPHTGGCFDGLKPHGVNLNMGAESTVSYLMARLDIEEMKRLKKSDRP